MGQFSNGSKTTNTEMNFVTYCLLFVIFISANGEIKLPTSSCRWKTTSNWNTMLTCDGNQVARGSCSGGYRKDCSGGTIHQLKCCDMEDFYYSGCNTYTSGYGAKINCRDHGKNLIMVSQCHSGKHKDCHGSVNEVKCCNAYYKNKKVRPTDQCTWKWDTYGKKISCMDGTVEVGRCGSGMYKDCNSPAGWVSQGSLCCGLKFGK